MTSANVRTWTGTEQKKKKKLAPVDQKEVLYNCKLVLLFSISSKSQRRAMDTHSLKVSMFPVKWSSPILQLFHSPALTLLTGLSVPDTISGGGGSGGGGSGGGGIECPHTLVLVLVLVSSCLPLVVFVHRNFFTLVSTESEQSIVLIAIASINTDRQTRRLLCQLSCSLSLSISLCFVCGPLLLYQIVQAETITTTTTRKNTANS